MNRGTWLHRGWSADRGKNAKDYVYQHRGEPFGNHQVVRRGPWYSEFLKHWWWLCNCYNCPSCEYDWQQSIFKCVVFSKVMDKPMDKSIRTTFQFPFAFVNINVEPNTLRIGGQSSYPVRVENQIHQLDLYGFWREKYCQLESRFLERGTMGARLQGVV